MSVVLETPAPSLAETRRRVTFRYECQRALSQGVLETAGATFLVLIAIRYFNASASWKALVNVGAMPGMLLSPLIVTYVAIRRFRATRAAAFLFLLAGCSMSLAAAVPWLPAFVIGSILAVTLSGSSVPLLTQMYQDNYPASIRGKLFSTANMIRIVASIAFGAAAGVAIKSHLHLYQVVMGIYAASLFYAAFCLSRIPSDPLAEPDPAARNPLYALRFLREDRTFCITLVAWMLMGFANLIMVALRVEYLANPRFGVEYQGRPLSAWMIALLTTVVPNLARLAMSPLWGHLFDRLNFFLLRILVNCGFAIAIVTFFTGNSLVGLLIGAAIFGISNAGGDLCWSLWVTKVAPPHRVAHYMSVHTFLTGLRGIASPFIAYALVTSMSLPIIALITAGLIALACLVLVPELLAARDRGRELEEQLGD